MSSERKDWTPNQLAFIEWLATPTKLRNPQDQRAFAGYIGVREETLSRWKKLSGLTEEAGKLARASVKDELADVYGALLGQAKAGSFQHIKLALEVAEHYVEKREHSGPEGGPLSLEIVDKILRDADEAS